MIQFAKQDLGMYDSATGKDVLAYKMWDASHMSAKNEKVVIKYAEVKRGRIAQICNWYTHTEDIGTTIHYFLNETTPEKLAGDYNFIVHSQVLGIDRMEFAQAIFEHQEVHETV
jgi:hypothetical protein